jgi:Flp pilus assembly protein TadG
MPKPTTALVLNPLLARLVRFRDDEGGSMSYFFMLIFVLMIIFGGIAVDVMRFETRRVALQQTMDRAALAAASLTQTRTPQEVVEDWFGKAGLGADLPMVTFSDPTVAAIADAGLRRVTVSARVRSNNFFMGIFSDNEFLEGPSLTEAAQGVSQIEVMMVLDITGSMNSSAGMADDPATPVNEAAFSRIQALRMYADEFVQLVKANDRRDGVSIGVVPYAAQVNLPVNLRNQFNYTHLSSWNGVPNAGVPDIDCMEIPVSTYTTTGLSLSAPIPMAAVVDAGNDVSTTQNYLAPVGPTATSRACTTVADNPATPWNEARANQVMMPTKDGEVVREHIRRLVAAGNTYIAVGMRWGTALIDEQARPIYTAIGDASVQGRPADNSSIQTRKIIILMTDGEHVTNWHIVNAFKTGASPIWRGDDGRYAIRYTNGGPALTNGTRPGCAGSNTYFVPHLQSAQTCMADAWRSTPSWPGSGTVRQLDWSEVWRYLRVSWVVRQLYMRSNVSGTNNFNTVIGQFRATYLGSTTNMDTLLQTNCTAARNAGIEIYGIAFNAPENGRTQIRNCSSSPKENYYFNASNGDLLRAAFRAIATDISELRLTQ